MTTQEIATTDGNHAVAKLTRSDGMNIMSRINEFQHVAQLFAQSQMFSDAKGAAQCFVKIMAGAELGIPPFTAMNAFHVIQGKVTMAANTIAARIKASGKYNYIVVEKSPHKCVIDFYEGGVKRHTETWDTARATKAGTKNMERYPDAMLFARAITSGARIAAPDVIGTFYASEELGADVDADGNVMSPTTPDPAPVSADNRAIVSTLIDQRNALAEAAKGAKSFSDAQKAEFVGRVNELLQSVNAQSVLRGLPVTEKRAKTSETFAAISKALDVLANYDQHAPTEENNSHDDDSNKSA